jgi:hypothetical protein
VGGEQAGELEHNGDAGAVVVGAWRVAGEVQDVGDPGVEVPGDDIEPLGVGIRGPASCTKLCCCTVIRPPEAAAKDCICWVTQAVAAPMPRFGSVWLDRVCLVPKLTSFWIVALIRAGSIRPINARKAGSNTCAEPALPDLAEPAAGAALAMVAWETIGAATAVTADAERNARRVEPRGRGTWLFSIQRIFGVFKAKSS